MNCKQAAALLLCCTALLLAGCSQSAGPDIDLPEPAFADGEPHQPNREVFRDWFKTISSTSGPCTVSVRDTIYDEEQAAAWWYAIQADLADLYRTLAMEEDACAPFTIYVVEETMRGPEAWNKHLYCTPEDILSGAYREGLTGAVLSVDELWKQIGLAGIAFDGEKANVKQLTAYLEATEEVDLLGLYAPYFSDVFASEEELSMARTAARLLCEHVIREHGSAMLAEDACLNCRQELLDELGVEHIYTDVFGDFDSGYTYSSSSEYPLIVTTPRGDTFNIVPLPGNMETPEEVCWLLYDAWKGPQVILEAIRAEAPEYADILEKNYSKPFTCTLAPNRQASIAFNWNRNRKIILGGSWSMVHEILHLIFPTETSLKTEWWKYEACADGLMYKYYPSRWYKLDFYSAFSPAYLNTKKTPHIYLAHADFPRTADEVDVMLFLKAMLVADHTFLSEEEYDKKWQSLAEFYQQDIELADLPNEGGNMLSYQELATFADYLIENYSLSTFLEYCLADTSLFEEVYGIDYETAEAAWLEDLMRMGEP